MNKLILSSSLTLALFLSACGLQQIPSNRFDSISLGMSRDEVTNLVGSPHLRNMDTTQEVWEYNKRSPQGDILTYLITFKGGKVSALKTLSHTPQRTPPPTEQRPVQVIVERPMQRPISPVYRQADDGLQNEEFKHFLSAVSDQMFTKDQIAYIRDAAHYNRFTSAQVKAILELFTWDSEKLEVLKALAPSLTDGYRIHEIIESFDFSSEKDKARKILGINR